ncbi:MAG: hypothetical protein IPO81_26775 [Kouleothrix sp.]|nr:hypothetical protein [Kouleothrix sp.]
MRRLVAVGVVVATLTLAASTADWALALAAGAIGALWLAGLWRGWPWVATIGLAGVVSLAALGAWRQMPTLAALTAACVGVIAWDLDGFARRLWAAGRVEARERLVRAHLRRLLVAAGLGWAAGALALGVRVRLSFGWALLLGLLAIACLWRVMAWVRGETP